MTPRLMLAAASSGSGKTTIACAILQALTRMGSTRSASSADRTTSTRCSTGRCWGVPSRNLDLFFSDEATAAYLLQKTAKTFPLPSSKG